MTRRPSKQLAALAVAASCLIGLTSCADGDSAESSTDATSSASPSPTSSGSTSPSASPKPSVRTLEITVSGSTVTPAPTRVKAAPGEQLAMVVTSDRAGVLHAHGTVPEIDEPVVAGTPTTVTFAAADQPGLYEIEMHDPDLLLFQLEVQ